MFKCILFIAAAAFAQETNQGPKLVPGTVPPSRTLPPPPPPSGPATLDTIYQDSDKAAPVNKLVMKIHKTAPERHVASIEISGDYRPTLGGQLIILTQDGRACPVIVNNVTYKFPIVNTSSCSFEKELFQGQEVRVIQGSVSLESHELTESRAIPGWLQSFVGPWIAFGNWSSSTDGSSSFQYGIYGDFQHFKWVKTILTINSGTDNGQTPQTVVGGSLRTGVTPYFILAGNRETPVFALAPFIGFGTALDHDTAAVSSTTVYTDVQAAGPHFGLIAVLAKSGLSAVADYLFGSVSAVRVQVGSSPPATVVSPSYNQWNFNLAYRIDSEFSAFVVFKLDQEAATTILGSQASTSRTVYGVGGALNF